ncbi:hypothetical protein GUJ93_ZPchr0007g5718 [Zizania palustris]|uniref:Plant heme peroxidase family profile domain-containing protein n=1 Tax=Zizania palustris TaxID=103762 RepID=A0A8J5TJP3_ZIZPA|nr:hypothetical protein GUJ93_ZPchr0007g5718 [Zizania palustris]
MRTTPSAITMAALSAAVLLLAALSSWAAAANDGQQAGQAAGGGGYVQPAYHQPVDGLDPGYYQHSCPDMEGIVQRAVKKAVAADYSLAAALIRLFFHDFAVGGTDASVLIDAPASEKYANASKTLRGFELIESIKTELERRCPKAVSCADILAAATRDASTEASLLFFPT